MVNIDTQESKQVVFAIVKETGTNKAIKDPAGGDIVYNGITDLESLVFLVAATNVGRDTNKTINRTDLVGTQIQRVTEGSVQKSLTVDFLALRPVAIGDTTKEFDNVGVVHGVSTTTIPQYALTSLGADKAINATNTYTIRVFKDCELDANEDADIMTALEILDYEDVHFASVSESAPGGGDVAMSIGLEAERVSYPAAWNSTPA